MKFLLLIDESLTAALHTHPATYIPAFCIYSQGTAFEYQSISFRCHSLVEPYSAESTMPTCTNTSCGQDFDPLNNGPKDCAYHPGAPVSFLTTRICAKLSLTLAILANIVKVFHEGSKAWCESVPMNAVCLIR